MKKGLKITLLTLLGLGIISSTLYAVEQATNHGLTDSIKEIFSKDDKNSVKEVITLKYEDFSPINYNQSSNGRTTYFYEYDFDYSKEYLIDSSGFTGLTCIGNLDYSKGLSDVPHLCESGRSIAVNDFPFTGEFNGAGWNGLLQLVPNTGIYSLSYSYVKNIPVAVLDFSQIHEKVEEESSSTSSNSVDTSLASTSSSTSTSQDGDVWHF